VLIAVPLLVLVPTTLGGRCDREVSTELRWRAN
jgi:hypothetical protein